jgi:drug/metabolite transporter (DMT)-like permease
MATDSPETRVPDTSKATRSGTLVGATAILMWATLAALTTLSGGIPPFQLLAMSFSLAFLIGLWLWRREGGSVRRHFRLPASVWALGLYGLFGYHFAYFMALRNAPPVEAGLIAYLWPLLIVLLAAFLPGERLRNHQMLGALAGFAGAALLVTKGQSLVFERQYLTGYAFALACALIWSSYSVLSRRTGHVPTSAVGAFCGATALLALVCHLLFETSVWPARGQWPAVIALGLGPVGAAFYTWDFGVKRGNIQTLGAFAYAAPLLSTLLLIALGLADPTWTLAVACVLIVGGALIAGK